MDSQLVACCLMAVYISTTLIAPRALRSASLLIERPRTLLCLWLGALGVATVSLLSALGIFIARALRHHLTHVPHHNIVGPLIDSILGWVSIAILGIIAFRLGVAAQELRAARRSMTELLSPIIAGAELLRVNDRKVWLVESPQRLIAALPQAHRVVVSSALREVLTPEELGAAVEHETSHLRRHHALILAIGSLAEAVAPGFLAGQRLAQSCRIATELIADDDAAKRCDRRVTAAALQSAYPDDPSIADRASRLLRD